MDSNIDFKYTIYKTTNKINGKVYIGCHKTPNPNDDYIGSGTILRRAIRKYGRENFEKEVLFVFNTPDEMFLKEAEIVDQLFVESETTYNLLVGGWGGFDFVNSEGKNLYGKNGDKTHGTQNLRDGREIKRLLMEKGLWDEWRRRVSEGVKNGYRAKGFHWTGRKHKETSKQKIGKKLSIAQRGERNSQYGTCWVYSIGKQQNLRIKKEELSVYLKHGWIQGRKINFNPVCKQVA